MKKLSQSVLSKLAALIARTESSYESEAHTSAFLAIQLMRKYGLLPEDLKPLLDAFLAKKPRKKRYKSSYFASIGGRKGGAARAAALSSEEKIAIARKAAQARWGKPSETPQKQLPKRAKKLPVSSE